MATAEYWAKRAEGRLTTIERGTNKYLDQIYKNNARVSGQIRSDVNNILKKFAENSNLTIEEARAILKEIITPAERQKLLEMASKIEDSKMRAQIMARVNAPSYKARIDRLEAVELATKSRVASIVPEQIQIMDKSFINSGIEMYNRTLYDLQKGTGLGFMFNQVTQSQLESVMAHNWSGRHYSERIWEYPNIVAEQVRNIVEQNITSGRSWRRCLKEIQDRAEFVGNYNTARLLRTETAYVAGEMEAEAYQETGLDEYRYVATLDGRTSEICQSLDGQKFKLKDRKVGKNYPPMHPNCRSTTTAVIDGLDLSKLKRRAKDPETGKTELVPADITYSEWKKGTKITVDKKH